MSTPAIRSAGHGLATGVLLLLGCWLGLLNVAVSGLIVSNTVRGIVPVSFLFVAAAVCLAAYVAVLVGSIWLLTTGRARARQLPRWLAVRLLIVGCCFAGLAILAMAV
jgi:hypothetical protein